MNDDSVLQLVNHLSSYLGAQIQVQRRIAAYGARREIAEIKEKLAVNPRRLELYGFKVYSQGDEDGIIEEIFNRLGICVGTFCEIGVENGLECNSLYLIHKGWRGCWLEGNSKQQEPIISKFSSLLLNHRLAVAIGYVTPQNINQAVADVLQGISINYEELDFLSIDIDGMDIYLLEAINFRPKVICIEYNAKFPPPVHKKPVFDPECIWRQTDYMGASLVALVESASQLGYVLVCTNICGANAFFVRADLVNDAFDTSLRVKELYNPCRYHLIADLYYHDAGHPADFGPYVDLI
ncbi:hypothetical protein AGMMS49960_09870 [Betaproteobacteria bacterium]|nr:hypothetical protein AGMMS49543_11160 [Betaproteobacteria bacterium]GHU00860.1 hypothetical protein AGMMS49960_09870 [Betaproteobacteria bacterium]GHU10701.1 hypothetical protein AGMMS50225_14710 [Betaproteobacteria bacterium]GHU19787.1 hypothetical protein AGMMS50243_12640 [Betaproteobacteria bacterium]